MIITRKEVYEVIDTERDYQDSRWGSTLSGNRSPTKSQPAGSRTVDEFSLYIVGYAHKLLDNASTFAVTKDKLDIIRKIAALCVVCMEQHGAPERK